MSDIPGTLTAIAAGLVAVAAGLLVAGGLYWLTVRVVDALGRNGSPTVGYPKALAAATLVLLAQLVAGGATLAPATAFAKVDWTAVGPGLVASAAVAGVAAVLAGVIVSGLILPAKLGKATAVGLVFGGLTWAVAGGALVARRLAA